MFTAVIKFLLGNLIFVSALPNDYWINRASLLRDEQVLALGGNLPFLNNERSANDLLMTLKKKEIDQAFLDPTKFLPAKNFIEAIEDIEKSEIFDIIKRMPKGAVLHAHDTAIVSSDWLYNVTYRENLYICEENSMNMTLHFFEKPSNSCDWKLLSDCRKNLAIAEDLNKRLAQKMTMVISDPDEVYRDVDTAWAKFMDIFIFIAPMLSYRPVYEDYYYEGLRQLYEDNVIYLEVRSTLPRLYELDGTEYEPLEVVEIYKNVTERFKNNYEEFIGAKIIYAPLRIMSVEELKVMITDVRRMKQSFPKFFAGFDLVGQEDKGYPLTTYADELKEISNEIAMFFHAGETNWYGMSSDENLVDAVLLNAKRVGHGFAVVKHPKVMEMMKKNEIAVEICPISNQVLGLVKDLRNHPASTLFAEGFPVVVSNDDPGLWGSRSLSYDFYEAFMGLMSRNADIRALKQLALNSLIYSTLDEKEKDEALELFHKKWDIFIDELVNGLHAVRLS